MRSVIEPALEQITLEPWFHPTFKQQDIRVDVLRLDKIHPEISGNKWFKLKFHLEKARELHKLTLASFGGAYSNHLLALASAARLNGFSSIGLIRGEEPAILSPVLTRAQELGMAFRFLSRSEYARQKEQALHNENPAMDTDTWLIPEGGGGPEGVRGAEEILSRIPKKDYSHFCCASGTGTTLAGLINSTNPEQIKIGVSVLKGTSGFAPLDISQIKNSINTKNVCMIHGDHFGGYAKYTAGLIHFMNELYSSTGIPSDFVYTGKLFYSFLRICSDPVFQPGSRVLILHSGGLAGNQSLPPGLLQF